MGQDTKIEWADHSWNPWIGCTKVSAGCANCYAESMDHRFGGGHWGKGAPRKRTSVANWKQPLAWNRKAERDGTRPRVFCASLADVFDPEVPEEWLDDLFELIDQTPFLIWMLLTKRPAFAARCWIHYGESDYAPPLSNWPFPHVWIGTSVEDQATADERIPQLLQIPAAKRFLSCEPLLGPVDLIAAHELYRCSMTVETRIPPWPHGIHWVIAGGESGPRARPMHPDWARSLRDQCKAAGLAFHFKQWGEWGPEPECRSVVYLERLGLFARGEDGPVIFARDLEPDRWHGWAEGEHGDTYVHRVGKKAAGRLLDGRTWDEVPA